MIYNPYIYFTHMKGGIHEMSKITNSTGLESSVFPYYAGSSTATSTSVQDPIINGWSQQGNPGDPVYFDATTGPWLANYGIYLVNYDITVTPASVGSFVSVVLLQDGGNIVEGSAVGAFTSSEVIKLSATAMVSVTKDRFVMPSSLSLRMLLTGTEATAPAGTTVQVANMTITLIVDEGRSGTNGRS